jgi:KUP system potassium uptake protein
MESVPPAAPEAGHAPASATALTLAALGIVFGDIGTSPLYAIRECFLGEHGVHPSTSNVLGVLSLVVWSLIAVVSVKYLGFIMRADNHGEGGIFALLALVPVPEKPTRARKFIVLLALFGAALLYGDGIITPSISVLSAVEGLQVATQNLNDVVVPITCAILVLLFLVQRRGTTGLGGIFGRVMLVWFLALAALGVRYILHQPQVLWALNPFYGIAFFRNNGYTGFVVLGSVVLCITGGEALYADMGHMGRHPIRRAWFYLVLPALVLNYFGQGAFLLEHPHPSASVNPFYAIVPPELLYPMVGLATVAAIIASQALISGAFSLTRQAVQLGYCPRVSIVDTSGEYEGQIYLPGLNTVLMIACVALVLVFEHSSRLAAAYGIAVTGTMAITSVVYFVVARQRWKWSWWQAGVPVAFFLLFDLAFLSSNLLKFKEGGWFPIAVAVAVYILMTTWKVGRMELSHRFLKTAVPLDLFLEDIQRTQPHRVSGTAVFMSSNANGTPPVLLHHLKHNQVLHQQVLLLTIAVAPQPTVPAEERLEVRDLGQGLFQVTAHYGFMQSPSVPEVMRGCRKHNIKTEPGRVSFYLGRDTLLTTGRSRMFRWRKALFSFISRNARSPTSYFNIPPGRVVELGMQIDL